MKLYIDQDNKKLITEAAFKAPVKNLSFKKGNSSQIKLIFVSGKTEQTALSTRSINFAIKNSGDYNGDYLVHALSADSITGTAYKIKASFDTSALNSLLSANQPSIDTILEIAWSDDDGTSWQATDTVSTKILNSVIQRP